MTWSFWQGEILGPCIALDTETTLADLSLEIPELVLVSVCDGKKSLIVKREDLEEFLLVHSQREWVGHNWSFDFWVVDQWLGSSSPARQLWWDWVDQNRVHDTLLLDQLVRLAKGDWSKGGVKLRNLEELSQQYAPEHQANKEDIYRSHFGELLEIPSSGWVLQDPGFFEYALRDVEATYHSFQRLFSEARDLQETVFPEPGQSTYRVDPECVSKYGVLSESLQIKASIALRKITLQGLCVDREHALSLEKKFRDQIAQDWDWLLENHPDWFKRNRKGQLILTDKGGFPSTYDTYLRSLLEGLSRKFSLQVPRSEKTRALSTSEKFWGQYLNQDPFLAHWVAVERSKSIIKFFDCFRKLPQEEDGNYRVHPSYITLKNTGRTGCSGKRGKKQDYDYPNIQQTPKIKGFREIYIATPGYQLLTIDYAAIELRTLATVCQCAFGYSKLREVLVSGVDPHAYTAAMMNGISLEEFLSWKTKDEKRFKKDRQSSKAINFGVPGGLGANKLVEYARSQYGVTLTKEQAGEFRQRLINEIYPEFNEKDGYLASTTLVDLCVNLKFSGDFVRGAIREIFRTQEYDRVLYMTGQVVSGRPYYKDGAPYPPQRLQQIERFVRDLLMVSRREDLLELWKHRSQELAAQKLYRELFGQTALTLTGRIRKGCGYTDSRNSPFQSLAADGAKLALWELCKQGLRVVAFVHDEVLVEVPESKAEKVAQDVERVLCEQMEKVLLGLVPVSCEYHLAREWKK